MKRGDKVELADMGLELGKITQAEHDKVMTEVMWGQVSHIYYMKCSRYGYDEIGEGSESLLNQIRRDITEEDGYWMDNETMDKYDHNTYMVTEEHLWYCRVKPDGEYWLFNGEWGAHVNGTDSEVCSYDAGHPENSHVEVTDWKEVTGSWMVENCEYFYRVGPLVPSLPNFDDFDDDVAF